MQDERQSLVKHLSDLRQTIIVSLSSLAITSVLGYFQAPAVMTLIKNVLPIDNLVFFGPMDAFYIRLQLGFLIGLILDFPVIAASLAWFLLPGMTAREKKIVFYSGVVFLLLFLTGVCYSLIIVLPLVMSFLLSFSTPEMMPVVSGEEYLTFVFSFMVYAGLVFELPLVVFLMVYLNILSADLIRRHRKYCLTLLFSMVLFFTPGGDMLTQFLMVLPLYLLFEMAVFIARLVQNYRINIRGDSNV